MITATLKLTRSLDDGGSGHRKYYLVADFAAMRGQGKASIIPLSAGAPMPNADQMTVRGGENEAILKAIDVIRELPGNEAYLAEVDLEPG
jgi:hypothetical protein